MAFAEQIEAIGFTIDSYETSDGVTKYILDAVVDEDGEPDIDAYTAMMVALTISANAHERDAGVTVSVEHDALSCCTIVRVTS